MKRRSLIMTTMLALLTIAGCQMRPPNHEQLKAEIMQDVLLEVRKQLAAYGVSGEFVADARSEMKWEIEQEVVRKLQMLAPDSEVPMTASRLLQAPGPSGPTGVAEGSILRNGEGLPDCRVILVAMVRADTALGLLKGFKDGDKFETVTDKDGKYRFVRLPAGSYKLKWQLPGDTGWIRRLRYEPDVTIEAGTTSMLANVETSRRLVPS